jgi:putative ABC transport system substrate-binding protein
LPIVGAHRVYAESGALMSFVANRLELISRAAHMVAKILQGTKPADIPVEQPTRFELIVNMKTAKALGLKVPSTVLVRADRLIE